MTMASWFGLLAIGSVVAGFGISSWARATRWGLPRWHAPLDRPLVCATCGRQFQYVTPEALPPGRESLAADGLLIMHVRAQHQEMPGHWHDRLPRRARPVGRRRQAEGWHARRRELLTEDEWLARQVPPAA